MRHTVYSILGIALAVAGCATEVGDVGSASDGLAVAVVCSVHGGGQVDPSGDHFGGSANPEDGLAATGRWTHVTAAGDHLVGTVDTLSCISNGGGPSAPPRHTTANRADFSGTATWNGEDGYTFRVHVEDRGEPTTRDNYILVVLGPDGSVVYVSVGYVTNGNIQLIDE